MKQHTAKIGSISSGTMRSEDLIPAFAWELEQLDRGISSHFSLLQRAHETTAYDPADIVDELVDALNDHAPPYCYFGAHPGDGTDFGFWPYEEFLQMVLDDGGLVVKDLAEVPNDIALNSYVLVVNDHGNCTLYRVTGHSKDGEPELFGEWAIV